MQTKQAKTHSSDKVAAKTAETPQKAVVSAASVTRVPVWASGMGDQLPVGLILQDASTIPGIQAKLAISQPNDPYEQEADRVAERVMRMPASPATVRRKCACGGIAGLDGECEACKQKRLAVQRRTASQSSPSSESSAPPIVHDVLQTSGRPLDGETRSFMESRFGTDFSQVRVHTDGKAAESAQSVSALAYTVGSDVVFGRGQYQPGTSEGQRLLAHELAHVVQQSSEYKPDGNISQCKHILGIQRLPQSEKSHSELTAPDLPRLEATIPHLPHFELTMPSTPRLGTVESMTIHHFMVNSSTIPLSKDKNEQQLNHLVELLNVYPEAQVHIEGHTDSTGTREYNQALSVQRAEAVKTALIQRGVNANRLKTEGFGKDRLLFSERTAEGKALNRRVEIWFQTIPAESPKLLRPVPIIPLTWSIIGGHNTPSTPIPPSTSPPEETPESRWRIAMQFTPQVPIRVVGTPIFSQNPCDYFAMPVGLMRNWEGIPAGRRWHFFSQPEFDLDFFPILCGGHAPSLVLQDSVIKLTILEKILEATLVAGISLQQGGDPGGGWNAVVQPGIQVAAHPFGKKSVWYREFQLLFNAGLNWTIPFFDPVRLPPSTLDVVLGVGVRLELPH